MKRLITLSLAAALLAFSTALILPLFCMDAGSPAQNNGASSALPDSAYGDADISVRALIDGSVQTLTMHDYLIGVLSAEMPASFHTEALRAQAVAARTYTLYKMLVAPSERHPEADVCDDTSCCKAFASKAEMRERWGDNYDNYAAKMLSAVSSTDSVCLACGGEPALAVFHSSSAGKTESSENVWGGSVPYLHSVDSPETESDVPDMTVSVTVSLSDFRSAVTAAHPEAVFPDGERPFSDDAAYSEGGRLLSVTVGGVSLSGTEIRSIFSLRSSAISLSLQDGAVTLTTSGSGHGVGMSQYGANVYAEGGWDYAEILLHYYDGASLCSVASVAG